VATAFSGNGMTYAHIAATMFTDLIHGRKNEWANLYNAKRLPTLKSLLQKGGDYSATFIGSLTQNFTANATK
jgi:hypothetical protein